jgi:flagellar biosynthesis protein FlhG
MAQSPQEGRNLFAKLTKVTDRFLDVALQYVGAVPYDECVRKAVQKQRAVYEAFPRSKCALAFKAIAQKVDTWPLPANPRGTWSFSSSAWCSKRQDLCYDRQRLQDVQEIGT